MRNTHRFLSFVMFTLFLGGVGGCVPSAQSPKPKLCEARAKQTCACVGEVPGTQFCYSDNSGWSPCDCLYAANSRFDDSNRIHTD